MNTGMKIFEPACSSLMSMLEPFFHGRSVDTGAIGSSFTPPLRGEGSFGSMPTASVPGKGCSSTWMPVLNSSLCCDGSIDQNLINPSGISGASAPMVGKSLPGRLNVMPKDFGTILSMCFFFQAEDGIRDYKVTGVQTCALPI